jgi:adenylate kinase
MAAEFGYDIFEAGGELRKIAASGSSLGETVKSYIDQGHLVPHEIIMQVVKEAIANRSKDTKILFDGIPRDENQMNDFNAIMKEMGRDFQVIHFLLSREEAVKRILGRAETEGRADDANHEIINRRMDTFETKTRPVIEEYVKKGIVREIDASGSVDDIYEEVETVIKNRQ